MHFPETSLGSRCLCGFGGMLGMRMHGRQRKIAKRKTQIVTELLLNRFNDWMGFPAGRTLVITVFQQRDRSTDWTLDVVSVVVRQRKFWSCNHFASLFSCFEDLPAR